MRIFFTFYLIIVIIFFLISINFNLKSCIKDEKFISQLFFNNKKKIIQIKMKLLMNIFPKKKSKI